MSLDTECNLAIEASAQGEQAATVRRAIATLRNRLLAEHLGVAVHTVDAAEKTQGLIGAIESLRGGARTLMPAETGVNSDLDALLPEHALIDPEQPLEVEYLMAQYVPRDEHHTARGHAGLIGCAALLFGGLAVAWRATPLHDYLDLPVALRYAEQLHTLPLALLWVPLIYVIAGLAVVPVVLLIAVTGMVFGPWLGVLYAVAGSLLSAATTYWIGRQLGQDALPRFLNGRLQRLRQQLQQRGILAVTALRLLPIAPFTLVNLLAGAAQINLRNFLLGTLFGMLPSIVATVIFVDRIVATLRSPGLDSLGWLAVAIIAIVALALFIQHRLRAAAAKSQPVAVPAANERSTALNLHTANTDSIHAVEPTRPR